MAEGTEQEPWERNPIQITPLRWFRGPAIEPHFNGLESHSIQCLARRYQGKTALVECLALRCLQEGGSVLWLACSNDNEAIAVCKAGGGLNKHVVLIGDDSVTVEGCGQRVVRISEFDPRKIPRRTWFVLARCLFPNQQLYAQALVNIVAGLKERISFDFQVAVCISEVAEFVKARILTGQSKTEREGSAEIESLSRQLVHFGISLIYDQVSREQTTSLELRSSASFTFIKNMGMQRLDSHTYRWMFRYLQDSVLRTLKKYEYLMLSDAGGFCFGVNQIVGWHHLRGSDLLSQLRWRISFDEVIKRAEEAKFRSTANNPCVLTGEEHLTIVRLREIDGLSLNSISRKLDRSRSACQDSYAKHLAHRCGCLSPVAGQPVASPA